MNKQGLRMGSRFPILAIRELAVHNTMQPKPTRQNPLAFDRLCCKSSGKLHDLSLSHTPEAIKQAIEVSF